MAEAVKNEADPTEPGQQVTALKNFGTAFGIGEDEEELVEAECTECGNEEFVLKSDSTGDPVVDHLVALKKNVEKKWRTAVLENSEED